MGGKDHDNRLGAMTAMAHPSQYDGNATPESETGTNAAKNLDDPARTQRHVRGHAGLKVLNSKYAGNTTPESETGTNAAKNLDDPAQTPRHVRGHAGLKVFNSI